MIRYLFSPVLPVLIFTAGTQAQDDPPAEDWIQLFNGENLDGWNIQIAGFALNQITISAGIS